MEMLQRIHRSFTVHYVYTIDYFQSQTYMYTWKTKQVSISGLDIHDQNGLKVGFYRVCVDYKECSKVILNSFSPEMLCYVTYVI